MKQRTNVDSSETIGKKADSQMNRPVMPTKVTQEDIGKVITSMASAFDDDLRNTPADKLDKEYWHFKWDDSASLEWNVYQFHDLLKLYGSLCHRWEEHHNGIFCVVERVRDKYLMPKIREFIDRMKRED